MAALCSTDARFESALMRWATQENWHDKLLTCNKTAHLCLISVKPTDQKVLSVWLHAKALQALTDLQAQEWVMTALSNNDNGLRTISTCRSLLCGALLCMGEVHATEIVWQHVLKGFTWRMPAMLKTSSECSDFVVSLLRF